ncbi:MAG: ABC transporter substrate-binding protein [Anaerolineales bacterium]
MKPEDRTPPNFDIFVSYSSQDKFIADAVVAAHEQVGIRCWYTPRDIAPGADWADSITQAIHDCKIMVLIFSKEANRSQRVIDEVNYAISQEKPLLPFRIEPSNPTGALSLHLSSRHWLDAYDTGWEAHIKRLVKSVKTNLENATDTIQISGGEAPSIVGGRVAKQAKRQVSLKTLGYVAGGLIVVSLLGFFGWNYLGKGKPELAPEITSPSPVESTPTAYLPEPIESQETSDINPAEVSSHNAVLHLAIKEQNLVIDPLIAGIQFVPFTQSLFLTLTGFDYENETVYPYIAQNWTISPDRRIYTFTLRPDIPWVTHALGGETVQVIDEEGYPRFLTASDFAYAFKRLCDPGFDNIDLRPTNIIGCSEVLEYANPGNIPPELFDEIRVEAVSDTELVFYLEEPSAYFLTDTANISSSAVPGWAIEEYGDSWTNPELIATHGAFVIDDWVPGESIRLVRNELFPVDMQGVGNIQTVEMVLEGSAYDLWLNNEVDIAQVPAPETGSFLKQFPAQALPELGDVHHFMIFNSTEFPFDKLHLRRAFSAGLNRSYLVRDVFQGGWMPMIHLAPPGTFGAPPLNEVGVGDDQEFARSELELAGYPECQGLPIINFLSASGFMLDISAEEIARSWEKTLGCPEGTIEYKGNILRDDSLSSNGWDILSIGWMGEYPDQEAWVGAILYCDSESWINELINRSCTEVDQLIIQAREEISQSDRIQQYRQIEEYFFGYEGTFPIAPMFAPTIYTAKSHWFDDSQGGNISDWIIDMDVKQAVLGE